MSNGATESGDDLVVGRTNIAQGGTELIGSFDKSGHYENDFVLQIKVPPSVGIAAGIIGNGGKKGVVGKGNTGVEGNGLKGVVGLGRSPDGEIEGGIGTGVEGNGNINGVVGFGDIQGVVGNGPKGVVGNGKGVIRSIGVEGNGTTGVVGNGQVTGVAGFGPDGVVGAGRSRGVVGFGSVQGVFGKGKTGVEGKGSTGVAGSGEIGVSGFGNIGVLGKSSGMTRGPGKNDTPIGVQGEVDFGIGVLGKARLGGFGVFCRGNFAATGTKSALVPHPDGLHRTLYCMESPESWFEDFGIGELESGAATVHLDPDFAEIVHSDSYHVFLTPEGDSMGLYISKKTPSSFEVREQQGGSNSLSFSYRVVSKRKDTETSRLEKVKLQDENLPEMPSLHFEE
ncbi:MULTISPECIES: hypothetical protein [Bacillaceae]